jgi:hypothetical protein
MISFSQTTLQTKLKRSPTVDVQPICVDTPQFNSEPFKYKAHLQDLDRPEREIQPTAIHWKYYSNI